MGIEQRRQACLITETLSDQPGWAYCRPLPKRLPSLVYLVKKDNLSTYCALYTGHKFPP